MQLQRKKLNDGQSVRRLQGNYLDKCKVEKESDVEKLDDDDNEYKYGIGINPRPCCEPP